MKSPSKGTYVSSEGDADAERSFISELGDFILHDTMVTMVQYILGRDMSLRLFLPEDSRSKRDTRLCMVASGS